MNLLKTIFLGIAIISLTSCATGYKATDPATTLYYQMNETKEATLSYKYDILKSKYSRKEDRKDIHLIAAKITNTSDRDLVVGKDVFFASENGEIKTILEPEYVYKKLKQLPGTHFFYLLLTPVNLYVHNGPNSTTTIPIGYAIGPGLSLGNFLKAKKANNKFKENINEYFIEGATIKAGETVSGLVGLETTPREPLTIVVK